MKKYSILLLLTLLAVLIASCVPDGVTIPESDLLRFLERKSGLIAFIGTDGNIYTIDQAGGDKTALTDDSELPRAGGPFKIYRYLSWSPDGSQVGFVGVSGTGGNYEDISVYAASTDEARAETLFSSLEFQPFYLYWSPDSEKLSFLASDSRTGGIALHIVSAIGSDSRQMDRGSPYYYVWSPGSEQVFVHSGLGTTDQFKFLPVESEGSESVLALRPSLFQAPAWSSDGESLYLAVDSSPEQSAIIEASLDGSPQRTLATFEGPIGFAIDATGERMAYLTETSVSPLGFFGRVRVIDLDSPEDIVETEESQVLAFFWSPDGEKLAYLVPVLLDPSEAVTVSTEPVPGLTLRVLDLGTEVSTPVANFRPTTEFLSILPYFDQYHHSTTIWSPDSNYLVISALAEEDSPAILIVPAAGGRPPRYIDDGLIGFWSWN